MLAAEAHLFTRQNRVTLIVRIYALDIVAHGSLHRSTHSPHWLILGAWVAVVTADIAYVYGHLNSPSACTSAVVFSHRLGTNSSQHHRA
jgi:hypothetical protein